MKRQEKKTTLFQIIPLTKVVQETNFEFQNRKLRGHVHISDSAIAKTSNKSFF